MYMVSPGRGTSSREASLIGRRRVVSRLGDLTDEKRMFHRRDAATARPLAPSSARGCRRFLRPRRSIQLNSICRFHVRASHISFGSRVDDTRRPIIVPRQSTNSPDENDPLDLARMHEFSNLSRYRGSAGFFFSRLMRP